jgi:hypothetical protein
MRPARQQSMARRARELGRPPTTIGDFVLASMQHDPSFFAAFLPGAGKVLCLGRTLHKQSKVRSVPLFTFREQNAAEGIV